MDDTGHLSGEPVQLGRDWRQFFSRGHVFSVRTIQRENYQGIFAGKTLSLFSKKRSNFGARFPVYGTAHLTSLGVSEAGFRQKPISVISRALLD